MKRICLATVGVAFVAVLSPRRSASPSRPATTGRRREREATTLPPLPADIKSRNRFIIGVKCDVPPFGYIDVQGKNAGFDVEIGSGSPATRSAASNASRSFARRPPRASRCSRPAASTS